MASASETVAIFMENLEAGAFERAAAFLSDDFTFIGLTPQVLNKSSFIQLMSELKEGIPGLAFHFRVAGKEDLQEMGVRVVGEVQMSGHQVNALNLYQLTLPIIPQRGRSFSLPVERWKFELREDKIRLIRAEPTPGGGIPGLVHQLGSDIPIVGQ